MWPPFCSHFEVAAFYKFRRKDSSAGRFTRYSELMRVKLLYFGVLRERFGASDEMVELSTGVAVGELLRVLRSRTSNDSMVNAAIYELDERLWRSLAVAVNREYSLQDVVLRDGDEVALLPPVSGGLLRGGRVQHVRRVFRVRRKASVGRRCQGSDERERYAD